MVTALVSIDSASGRDKFEAADSLARCLARGQTRRLETRR